MHCSAGALNAAFLASDPSLRRARDLADWWTASDSRRVLAPSRWSQLRGVDTAVFSRLATTNRRRAAADATHVTP